MNKKKKSHLINDEIIANQVRLAEDGRILSLLEAKNLADSKSLDLVLINQNSTPPIVKIMNYEKFIYEMGKKPKNKSLELKEIKIGPNTSENDLGYRIKQINEFLEKGHKVKISMRFKGREVAHLETSQKLILKMITEVDTLGAPEFLPKFEGKVLFVIIRPKTKN
jgi:translation initiation factor IF-3